MVAEPHWPSGGEFAKKAEDLGYSTLILPDHFTEQLAPPTGAGYCRSSDHATAVSGPEVLANEFRHPAVLAKEAATVDLLTEGRFELGIGTGSVDADNEQAGLPLNPPAVRVARIVETLAILKAFFTQDTVAFEGKH